MLTVVRPPASVATGHHGPTWVGAYPCVGNPMEDSSFHFASSGNHAAPLSLPPPPAAWLTAVHKHRLRALDHAVVLERSRCPSCSYELPCRRDSAPWGPHRHRPSPTVIWADPHHNELRTDSLVLYELQAAAADLSSMPSQDFPPHRARHRWEPCSVSFLPSDSPKMIPCGTGKVMEPSPYGISPPVSRIRPGKRRRRRGSQSPVSSASGPKGPSGLGHLGRLGLAAFMDEA
jgi:hypothetical protein